MNQSGWVTSRSAAPVSPPAPWPASCTANAAAVQTRTKTRVGRNSRWSRARRKAA